MSDPYSGSQFLFASICVHLRLTFRAPHVRTAPAELTGVLAPLRDRSFFERVYIDQGAVAWPGEIDLAPDAMYEQVAKQGKPAPAR